MTGWQAFQTGLARTLRYPQVWLAAFVVNVLSALLLAALPALSLASGLGHRPAIRQLADGLDAWYVIELMMSPLSGAALEGGGAAPELAGGLESGVLFAFLVGAALPLVAWLPAAFLNGGLLLTFHEAPQRFRWRRFLWGCWHWWGAFLLLGAAQGFVSVFVLLPLTGAALGLVAVAGGWSAWIVVPLLLLLTIFGLALMEYTRAFAVVDDTRNVFGALGRAFRFVFGRPLAVGLLYGLTFLLAGLLHVLFRLGLMPALPLEIWPLVLVVQQTFIALRLGTRLVRQAGGLALIPALAESEAASAAKV